MGVSYDLHNLSSEAAREYQESLRYDGSAFAPHLRLGSSYARMGHYAQAVAELNRASELDPTDMQAHYFLAVVYSAQRDFVSAANEYETILKHFSDTEPKNIQLLLYLGQLYYAQGKLDKAFDLFERVYKADPRNVEVAYLIGNFYLEKNRRADAVKAFKACIEADPFQAGCLNALGYIYAESGDNLDEAQKLIKRALEIDPKNPAYLDSLGWTYYQKGQYEDALAALDQVGESTEDPVVYDHLGDVHFKLGHMELAAKYWQLTLDLDPQQQSVRDKLEALGKKQTLNSQGVK
ncbi:MAG: tetratricopeptide repeat protein [Candidatus Omnitrophica bacterium]|nr:tetratricopeptide repeat protein [Candidatus Omnitrophota bacterium]